MQVRGGKNPDFPKLDTEFWINSKTYHIYKFIQINLITNKQIKKINTYHKKICQSDVTNLIYI